MSSTPELPGPLPWEIGGGRFDEWIEDANGAYIALDVALAYLNAAPAREAQARADALEEAAKVIDTLGKQDDRWIERSMAAASIRVLKDKP